MFIKISQKYHFLIIRVQQIERFTYSVEVVSYAVFMRILLQATCYLPMNYLSVFDYFVGLAFKGLIFN